MDMLELPFCCGQPPELIGSDGSDGEYPGSARYRCAVCGRSGGSAYSMNSPEETITLAKVEWIKLWDTPVFPERANLFSTDNSVLLDAMIQLLQKAGDQRILCIPRQPLEHCGFATPEQQHHFLQEHRPGDWILTGDGGHWSLSSPD